MLNWFRARGANARKAKELYGTVVAAARQPGFYRRCGVPDTMNGRYEMIVINLFQLLERLRREGTSCEEISRLTLEAFFTDMDDAMREIGIGDMGVPKKVKKAAAGFYERARIYRLCLDADDEAGLADALSGFILGQEIIEPGSDETPEPSAAPRLPGAWPGFDPLARHMFRQRDALNAAEIADVLNARAFLEPAGPR